MVFVCILNYVGIKYLTNYVGVSYVLCCLLRIPREREKQFIEINIAFKCFKTGTGTSSMSTMPYIRVIPYY